MPAVTVLTSVKWYIVPLKYDKDFPSVCIPGQSRKFAEEIEHFSQGFKAIAISEEGTLIARGRGCILHS